MKKIKTSNLLLGALLGLVMASAVGCVVADRPYYYNEPYRRYDTVRPYDRFWWNYWNRDHARWHRDRDRSDRD